MTQNKLSIHDETGETFYHNHNTGENFYNFLLSQQNDEAAYVPNRNSFEEKQFSYRNSFKQKQFSYRNSFEAYISSFLQSFSIDDQEKLDLLAFKNWKYLFFI